MKHISRLVFGLVLWTTALAAAPGTGVLTAGALTNGAEQKHLVESLSGAALLGVGGLPDVLSQRFSDSPEIHTTAKYLRAGYEASGIHTEVLEYDPLDAFPYYFQNTAKTYRSYFVHMLPMLRLDFDGFCAATLPTDRRDVVLKRLKRVALEPEAFCRVTADNRVETYIRTTIEYSTSITKKLLTSRSQTTWPNVLAYVPTSDDLGEYTARPLCVIGAHMDSVARDGGGRGPIVSPATLAPGADDNGSGTAAVMTLARGFADWIRTDKPKLACDLAFLHFSGEEEGLIGSIAFVRLQTKRPIRWMVNFDMIAYNSGPVARMNVGYDKAFGSALPQFFAGDTADLKTLIVERSDFIYSSDQIAFWDVGVPAISISEQACSEAACRESFKFFNPHLHTPDDVAGILDFDYAANIINHSYDGLKKLLLNGTRH